jgi:adenylate cyclase
MIDTDQKRRLAAILAADVAGYSRLMAADESATVAALGRARAVFRQYIESHRGRVIDMAGDSVLAVFDLATGGVTAALVIQQALGRDASAVPEDRRMRFRIGVHLGEIIEKSDGTVYGDGVNIAARLEGLAEPGGIAISDALRGAVRSLADTVFTDLGPQAVKNITEPVRAFRVHRGIAGPAASAPAATEPVPAARGPAPTLPDKPSIAVLPFSNMSTDPEQEHFADGMTEDLITDLAKVSGLFVVARNSTFAYKGRQVDVRDVARDLGVRYVLEGSVRKAGEQVRINVQLIDAANGGHLWAERHDGTVANVFELQDEVGAKVVSALAVTLKRGEEGAFSRVHTHNLEAFELFVRAKATPFPPVPERMQLAREMFERVIELDPAFAGGYAGVAWILGFQTLFGHMDARAQVERAIELARKAIDIDRAFSLSHLALGIAMLQTHGHDAALAAMREAIVQQPNDADAHAYLGMGLGASGATDEGIASLEYALRLNPQFVNGPYLNLLGFTQVLAGRYDAAVTSFERNLARRGPYGPPAQCWRAAALWARGRRDDARAVVDELKRTTPAFRLSTWNYFSSVRDAKVRDRVRALMRDAGVPD